MKTFIENPTDAILKPLCTKYGVTNLNVSHHKKVDPIVNHDTGNVINQPGPYTECQIEAEYASSLQGSMHQADVCFKYRNDSSARNLINLGKFLTELGETILRKEIEDD